MKLLISTIVILLLSNTYTYSQEENPPADQQVIFLGIFGLSQNDTRNFTTSAQGIVWGNYYLDPFTISEDEAAYQSTYQQTGNSGQGETSWGGWDIVTFSTIPEVIGYGLYKMTTDDSPAYFYYNTRDCHYSNACGSLPPNYLPDAAFKYLANDNIFQYRIRGQSQYTNITNGQLINSWDMLNYGTLPSTNGFEDYWENALVATNNGNNHPRLVWGPYPNDPPLQGTITGYKIYRSAVHNGGEPPTNFSYLATVGSNVFFYVDNTVTMGYDYNARSYYVKCVYEDQWDTINETQPTNTVEVRLEIPQKRPGDNENNKSVAKYSLSQNYPNPFNPSTRITYSVAKNGQVSLKIFDILGKEIAVLVDELKDAGNYEIEFSVKEIPSGIYFYRLTTENYIETKKMILLR